MTRRLDRILCRYRNRGNVYGATSRQACGWKCGAVARERKSGFVRRCSIGQTADMEGGEVNELQASEAGLDHLAVHRDPVQSVTAPFT